MLILYGIFELQSVFTGQVFEVFNILEVYLFNNFLKILGFGSLHVGTELKLLFLGQQGDLVSHRRILGILEVSWLLIRVIG